MGLWNWASQKAATVTAGLSYTYSLVTTTLDFLFVQPIVGASNLVVQTWEGFSRVFDPNNVTKIAQSPKTRSTLAESFKANIVFYLSFALLVETTKEAILARVISGEDTWGDTTLYLSMNALAMLVMSPMFARRLYDNTMLNIALTSQACSENPLSPHFETVKSDSGAVIKAGVMSPVYLGTELASLWAASFIPIIKYGVGLGKAQAYGESLAEVPLSAANMSTEQRTKELSFNDGYSFGMGAAMYAMGELLSWSLSRYTGVNSIFISNAIYSAIYPYFITAALFRDRPIPGRQKNSWDIFYYHRYLMERVVPDLGAKLLPLLQNQAATVNWKAVANAVAEFPPARITYTALSYDLYSEWRTVNGFFASTPNVRFFDEYYLMIRTELKRIIDLRDKPLLERPLRELPMAAIAPIVPFIPNALTRMWMTPEYKRLVRAIFRKELEDPLKGTWELLEEIRRAQKASQIRIVDHGKAGWQQALRKEAEQREAAQPKIEELPDDAEVTPKSGSLEKSSGALAKVGMFAGSEPRNLGAAPVIVANSDSGALTKSAARAQAPADEVKLTVLEEMRAFLVNLKSIVDKKVWDTKGVALFGNTKTPDTIKQLRIKLSDVRNRMHEENVRAAFEEVKALFANYKPDSDRNPEVTQLYARIVSRVGDICNRDTKQSISMSYSH